MPRSILKKMSLKQRRISAAYILALPAIVTIFIFRLYPLIEAFFFSFYDYNILMPDMKMPVGLSNYAYAFFDDPQFFASMKLTFVFALMKVVFQLVPAFFLASLLQKRIRGIGILRTAVLAPTVTSLTVVAVVWNLLYDPNHGIFNSVLNFFGLPSQPFLTSPTQALPSLLGMMLWKDMGFTTIVFMAGLQAIPSSFYEAASIDGANLGQRIVYITLPLLRRTTYFLVTMMIIWSFQVFTPIYIATKGGPMGSTRAMVYYIYENAFIFMDMGYALALSMILLVVILMISVAAKYVFRSDVEF